MFLNPRNKRNLIIKHVGVTYNWRLTGKGLKKDEFKFVRESFDGLVTLFEEASQNLAISLMVYKQVPWKIKHYETKAT